MTDSIRSLFIELFLAYYSRLTGIDIKALRRAMEKHKGHTSTDTLSDAFDDVTAKLQESKEVIEDAMQRVDEQRKLTQQLKEEAEASQQLANLNKEQMAALTRVLDKSLAKNDKHSLPRNLLINFIFCVLGAILGYVFGRLLP